MAPTEQRAKEADGTCVVKATLRTGSGAVRLQLGAVLPRGGQMRVTVALRNASSAASAAASTAAAHAAAASAAATVGDDAAAPLPTDLDGLHLPLPAEWLSPDPPGDANGDASDASDASDATHAVAEGAAPLSVTVRGIAALCRASAADGCGVRLHLGSRGSTAAHASDATDAANVTAHATDATTMPKAEETVPRAPRRALAAAAAQPPPQPAPQPARWAAGRRLQTQTLWSSLAGGAGYGSSDDVVVSASESWVLDADMSCRSLTVQGSLTWDTTKDGLTLQAGYVVIEGAGAFELGSAAAPMLFRATIRLLDNGASHPYLGARVLGGDGVAAISASTDEERFHSGNGSSGVTRGYAPRIDIHGAPLGRSWSLLSATARAGDTQLLLEHDPAAMGWVAGDELGIATTARGAGQRVSIASVGAALQWELGAAGANASHERPEDGEGADMAVDGTDETRWRSYDAAVAGTASTDWLLVRLHEPSVLRALTLTWDVPGRPATFSLHVRSGTLAGGCALPAAAADGSGSDASSGYTWTTAASDVAGGVGAWQSVSLSGVGGDADVTAVRIWANTAATAYGVSLWEVRVLDSGGSPLTPSGASATFEQSSTMAAAMAIDGDDSTTRWATNGSPEANDWLVLTFASPGVLPATVELLWEDAYASSFSIDVGRSTAAPSSSSSAAAASSSDAACAWSDVGGGGGVRTAAADVEDIDLVSELGSELGGVAELLLRGVTHLDTSAAGKIGIKELTLWGREAAASPRTAVYVTPALTQAALGGTTAIGGRRFALAAEVAHLSRTVLITGDHADFASSGVGLHTILAYGGEMRVSHTRVEYCGQQGVLGRYCLHFHHVSHCAACALEGNAVVYGYQKGITVHDTHDATVSRNVLWDVKGVGLYVEDGNELNNTLEENVVLCPTMGSCNAEGHEDSGIYLIGMSNHLLRNRVAGYETGTYTPGENKPIGQGIAWGRVTPQHFPFGKFEGNVNHDNNRYGLYLGNQLPRRVARDFDGFLVDDASANEFTAAGDDNGGCGEFPAGYDGSTWLGGALADGASPCVVADGFEWHNLFVGQYKLGDIQYLRYTSVNNLHHMYWKESKNFADGASAHLKDAVFASGGPSANGAAYGDLQLLGPAGPFTFLLDNVSFVGSVGAASCGALCAGQHCGLASHNGGVHGSLCNVQYELRSLDWSQISSYAAGKARVAFGVSGGNPIVPTFTALDASSLDGHTSLISPLLNGFASVDGCAATPSGGVWGGAAACSHRARRLSVWSASQGVLTLSGPGYDGVSSDDTSPVLGANAGRLRHDALKGSEGGYGAVVLEAHAYALSGLSDASLVRAIEFSDPARASAGTAAAGAVEVLSLCVADAPCWLNASGSRRFISPFDGVSTAAAAWQCWLPGADATCASLAALAEAQRAARPTPPPAFLPLPPPAPAPPQPSSGGSGGADIALIGGVAGGVVGGGLLAAGGWLGMRKMRIHRAGKVDPNPVEC